MIRDLGEQRPAMVRVRQLQQPILAGTTDGDLGIDVKLPGVREVAGGQLVRDAGDPAQRHAVLHLLQPSNASSASGLAFPGHSNMSTSDKVFSYLSFASLAAMSAYSVTSAVSGVVPESFC